MEYTLLRGPGAILSNFSAIWVYEASANSGGRNGRKNRGGMGIRTVTPRSKGCSHLPHRLLLLIDLPDRTSCFESPMAPHTEGDFQSADGLSRNSKSSARSPVRTF